MASVSASGGRRREVLRHPVQSLYARPVFHHQHQLQYPAGQPEVCRWRLPGIRWTNYLEMSPELVIARLLHLLADVSSSSPGSLVPQAQRLLQHSHQRDPFLQCSVASAVLSDAEASPPLYHDRESLAPQMMLWACHRCPQKSYWSCSPFVDCELFRHPCRPHRLQQYDQLRSWSA